MCIHKVQVDAFKTTGFAWDHVSERVYTDIEHI